MNKAVAEAILFSATEAVAEEVTVPVIEVSVFKQSLLRWLFEHLLLHRSGKAEQTPEAD